MPSPLIGLRVVDLSRHLPGPLTARLLADLGARVIKIEEPRVGDPVRDAPPLLKGQSSLAAMLLAGVESVALDLKNPAARGIAERLMGEADILLESFRPGTLARFGWAPEELRRRYPKLVICSISGWGQTGPLAKRAGHDLTYEAMAGLLAPLSPSIPPAAPLADLAGAWSATTAILAALLARARTGEGTWIDASLYDAGLHSNLVAWAAESGEAREVGEPLALTGGLPCYAIYETADREKVAFAPLEPHFWKRFCAAVERADLEGHQYDRSPRFRRKLERLFASRTRQEWNDLFEREDLPASPILSARAAREHPHAQERDVLRNAADGLPRVGFPARFDGERPRGNETVPTLGEHTEAVLQEHGIQLDRRARKESGVGKKRDLRASLRRFWLRFVRG